MEFSEAGVAKWDFLSRDFHNPAGASRFLIPSAASCSAHQPAARLLLNHRLVNPISTGRRRLPSPGGRRAAPMYANAAVTRLSVENSGGGGGTCTPSAPEN